MDFIDGVPSVDDDEYDILDDFEDMDDFMNHFPLETSAIERAADRFREHQGVDIRLEPCTFRPMGLHVAHKMRVLLRFVYPNATETMRVAAQAMHLYPHLETPGAVHVDLVASDQELRAMDADLAHRICLEAGYTMYFADRVASLIRLDNLEHDLEARQMQDIQYLARVCDAYRLLIDRRIEPKVELLRAALKNMTPYGREFLLQLPMLQKDGVPITHL